MKVEQWQLSQLRPYEQNPRNNDDAVDTVAASIREFGFRQPIVVDETGVIIVGHTRFKAAQKLRLIGSCEHTCYQPPEAWFTNATRLRDTGYASGSDHLFLMSLTCLHRMEF